MANFIRHFPGHDLPITIEPNSQTVIVEAGGQCVARSKRALTVYQAGKTPIVYLPKGDVIVELAVSEHGGGRDPIGKRNTWNVVIEGRLLEGIAWSYYEIVPGLDELKDHVAFDSPLVDRIREVDPLIEEAEAAVRKWKARPL